MLAIMWFLILIFTHQDQCVRVSSELIVDLMSLVISRTKGGNQCQCEDQAE